MNEPVRDLKKRKEGGGEKLVFGGVQHAAMSICKLESESARLATISEGELAFFFSSGFVATPLFLFLPLSSVSGRKFNESRKQKAKAESRKPRTKLTN